MPMPPGERPGWPRSTGVRAEAWLRIAKRHSGLASVTPAEALDVALCYGWKLAVTIVPIAYTAWSLWLLAAGVVLLTRPLSSPPEVVRATTPFGAHVLEELLQRTRDNH